MQKFDAAPHIEEKKIARAELEAYYAGLSEKEEAKKEIITSVDNILNRMMHEIEALLKSQLVYQGRNYDLNEWLTVSRYAEKYNYSVPRVTNWINRGIIPPTKKIVIPELNNLTLLHDEQYKDS